MPTYELQINGTPVEIEAKSISGRMTADGISTVEADLYYPTSSAPPAQIDDDVAFIVNGVTLIGAVITDSPNEGIGGPNLDDRILRISAASYEVLPSFQYVTATFPAGSVLDFLTALQPFLTSYNITIDPAQAPGPAIEEIIATRMRADELLNLVSTMTAALGPAWIWRVDTARQLSMFVPGTGAHVAPFNILDTGPPHQVGDVKPNVTRDDTYANRIILVVSAGPATSTEYFVAADGVTVGGFIYFTTKYPASTSINDYWPNELYFNSAAMGPIGRIGPNPGDVPTNAWDWDPANHRLRYTIASGAAFPTTEQITILYSIEYPIETMVEDIPAQAPPVGIRARVINVPQGLNLAAALQNAQGLLATKKRTLTQIPYSTYDTGLEPGQSQTVTIAKLGLNSAFTISSVNFSMEPESSILRYDVILNEGTTVQGDFRQVPKDWLKDTGGAAVARTGVSMGGPPAPPHRAVQFNRTGRFGGILYALIDEDDTGDRYGIEAATAMLALGQPDDGQGLGGPGSRAPLALYNDYAGREAALTFWVTNGLVAGKADALIELGEGSSGTGGILSLQSFGSAAQVTIAAPDISISGDRTLIGSLNLLKTQLPAVLRTTASLAMDPGSTLHNVVFHDSASNHTYSLLPLAHAHVLSLLIYQRQILVTNSTAGGTFTIDPDGSETINGAATLVLAPGESCLLQAWSGTGSDWKALRFFNSGSVSIGSGSTSISGGADTQVLFNDGGLIGGDNAFTFDKATGLLKLGTTATTGFGTSFAVYNGDAAAPATTLNYIDLEPGLDLSQTIPVGQNAIGLYFWPSFTAAASGTHALVAGMYLDGAGSITAGAATITAAATFVINSAPSEGVDNYAFKVNSGLSRFDGTVAFGADIFAFGYLDMGEIAAPSAPISDRVRIYAEDNGAGKTRLMALFSTGAAQQMAIEP